MVAKQIEIVSQCAVNALAFVDESQVVAGYQNGDIRRWKIEDGRQLGPTLQASGAVFSLAVSQDGRWIVSGDNDFNATLWDAITNQKVRHAEYGAWVGAVDISSDCTKVVVGSWDPTDNVQLFDISSGIQLLPPISHGNIRGIKFSPDGSCFATASSDCDVRVYSTHDGKVLFRSGTRNSTLSTWIVTPLVWSTDGQQLFVASKGKITSFNISDSSSSEWPIRDTEADASIASNGKFIAFSASRSVSLWDYMSHGQLGSITHTAWIRCIALSPSGGYLACSVDNNITIHNLGGILRPEYFGSGLPLVRMSVPTFKSWMQGIPTNTEALLSEEIKSASIPIHDLLACRAILRARLKHMALAMEDGKQSLRIRSSPIGYIAMAVVLLGEGDREGALRVFDLAFHDCKPDDNKLLLLLKSILMFESGNQEDAIKRVELLAARANDEGDNEATYLYAQVLAVMHMKEGDYGRAVPLIKRVKNLARKGKQYPLLMTISLIFGWSFLTPDHAPTQVPAVLSAQGHT